MVDGSFKLPQPPSGNAFTSQPLAGTYRLVSFAIFLLACAGCADTWGTPAYFERILSVQFEPDAPVIRCETTGLDYVAFRVIHVPATTAVRLGANAEALGAFPHQAPHERERILRRWTSGNLSTQAREALDLALSGAEDAVVESNCGGVSSSQIREWLNKSLARPTTLHSYQFQQVSGETRVVAEALEFRIFDPVEGLLFELVNFS
jgi:hypothetical protein